jgi:poly(A) polymerase
LLELHLVDALASGHSTDHVEYCNYLLKEWSAEELNPEALISGHDLTRHGLSPGPEYKGLLDAVREAQLEGTVKTAKQALELVDQLRAKVNE